MTGLGDPVLKKKKKKKKVFIWRAGKMAEMVNVSTRKFTTVKC